MSAVAATELEHIPLDANIANCTYTGGNCIIPEWKQKESLVRFMIEYGFITLQSERCSKVFKTIPSTWTTRGIAVQDAIKTLEIMTDLDKLYHAMIVAKDDEDLVQLIGAETYGLIKFLLHLNHMNNVIYIEKCKVIFQDYAGGDVAASAASVASRYKQFKFSYTPEIESKFQKTRYLFHGTPAENIIPILATGLRNCSKNSDLQLNGAAYGHGIYLSDSAEFSLGSCHAANLNGNNMMAMLVYEVLDNPKWFKTTNIYVVDDETALVLRYIIVVANYNFAKDAAAFKKLTSIIANGSLKEAETKKEKEKMAVMTKAYNRRLMIEYRQLMKKTASELGFTIKLAEEDNLRVWTVYISAVNLDNPSLEAQMQKLNIPALELEISFPDTYPIEPPFPRVIHPRFQSLTGHITAGGSICMEAISRSGWVPTTNMESLITQIKLVLADGNARIDETHLSSRYNIAEAKEAFLRAMATHGWA